MTPFKITDSLRFPIIYMDCEPFAKSLGEKIDVDNNGKCNYQNLVKVKW